MITKKQRQSSRSYGERKAFAQMHAGRTPQRDPLFVRKNQATLLSVISGFMHRSRVKRPAVSDK
ncbi:MAG TPA: hypothetical protein VD757_01820 [Candidatus Nitrosocosmicus sp.]|nr:hypothetical protein [Candidatus Nitrosocosmicus sp.]